MNKKAKKRLIVVTLLIVVIAVVILAVVGGSGAAETLSVSEAASGDYADSRVQVSGTVVDNSYVNSNDGISFDVFDPDNQDAIIHVIYEGAVPATFGNGVTAISTGTMQADGSLLASELLTKCPSKYESAEGSLTVSNLLESASSLEGQEVKLAGYVKEGTLVAAGEGDRFTLYSQDQEIAVVYDGALPEDVTDDSSVILTGSLASNGKFIATAVAQENVQ